MALMGDSCVVLVSQITFFAIGWIFLMIKLPRRYENPNRLVQVLFCLTFSLSLTMFEILIFEILGWLDSESRILHWKTATHFLVVIIAVVIPLFILVFLVASRFEFRHIPSNSEFCSSILMLLLALANIGASFFFASSPRKGGFSITDSSLVQVGIVAVTLMAFLSGFGAVNTSYTFLSRFYKSNSWIFNVRILEKMLEQEIEILAVKKKQYAILCRENMNVARNGDARCISLRHVVQEARKVHIFVTDTENLKAEIDSVQMMCTHLFLKIDTLNKMKQRWECLRMLRILLPRFLELALTISSIYKIVNTIRNIIRHRSTPSDPVIQWLGIAVNWMGFSVDVGISNTSQGIITEAVPTAEPVRFWLQYAPFGFIGFFAFTSIRGQLITLKKFFHFSCLISNSRCSDILVLVLAEIMGMYFISTILLMGLLVPPAYRVIISAGLGELQFRFCHRWFDVVFLISAFACTGFGLMSLWLGSLPHLVYNDQYYITPHFLLDFLFHSQSFPLDSGGHLYY